MKQYLVPFILILFLAFGLVSGTSYAAETHDTNSANNAVSTETTTSVQTPAHQDTATTQQDVKSSQQDITTAQQDTKPTHQDTTSHQDVTSPSTQPATSAKSLASSQGSAFSKNEKSVETPSQAVNKTATPASQEVATSSKTEEKATTEASTQEVATQPTTQENKSSKTAQDSVQQPQNNNTAKTPNTTTDTTQKVKTETSQDTTQATKSAEPAKPSTKAVAPSPITSTNTAKHTILHTNDIHGRFVEDEGRVIGMAKVKGLKEQYHPDLVVDSGDAFQGLPVSNKSKGEEMAKAMNGVGYAAMTIGNHEFDFGYDQLMRLQKQLNFPMVSSNIYKNGQRVFQPSTIVNKNNIRYGIVGVTTPETKTKTSPTAVEGVEFKDPLPSVTQAMTDIKNKVDVFVILSHLGVDKSTKSIWRGDYLIDQLTKSGAFKQPIFVLDGHSHTVIEHGEHFGTNNVLAQTGTALANVGRVDFNFQNKKASDVNASLINVADAKDITADPQIEAQTKKANDEFLKETSTVVIPNNTVTFNGERAQARTQETNLGNLITDAMEAYGAKNFSHQPDFAVTNGGGIRASIEKGKVTENDIITVLPFGNLISQIQVKGSDVEKAFEHSLGSDTETQDGKTVLAPNGGFLQVSDSIRVYFDINKEAGHRVNAIKVLNKETGAYEDLDPNRTYYVTTNDFTANQGDGYDMFGGQREEGISLDAVVAQYIKEADLSKYDTTEAVRIINGQPESDEQPNTGAHTGDNTNNANGTPQPSHNDSSADVDAPKHNGEVAHHEDQDAHQDSEHHSSSENEATKGHVASGKHNHHKADNIIAFPTPHQEHNTNTVQEANHSNHTVDCHKVVHLNGKSHSSHNTEVVMNKPSHKTTQLVVANHYKTTAHIQEKTHNANTATNAPMTSHHTPITQLPNTGKNGDIVEHGIAIVLVITGAGLVYLRNRKKSA
ncbi:5'-nucleotidase [Staphylococcus petrasii]|uniref:5'-nucleotidase n=1 Tax=Staphylococcus petrasii TaxID=1276936 RepID=A0A380G405_9STAP|nr:5'-nucleotidase C-terminal domain-containing protein [Staphylococcus petrasii]PNZ30843.1 bifunctional metallophosphatase/5'-nucleotidase [Staphylococcus petrasii]TGE11082.1 bifunctional metallophosphatase/5'-nucleotidase [Staphylococcus petrasii]TGE16489.1 bifunctional metallophosphatase/5'-nucleotidase [Staphylococcus petrasii]SUM45080.1 5'-nucleotidase [Staphylococcus petrasii]